MRTSTRVRFRTKRMTRVWGKPCPDFHEKCAVCVAWQLFYNRDAMTGDNLQFPHKRVVFFLVSFGGDT